MDIEIEETREPTIFNSLLMCFFVGILLFIALLYRQSELSLLSFLVLLVIITTKIWSAMSHYRMSYKVSVDKQRVFPDETFTLEATVKNAKLLPIRVRIQWAPGSALSRVGEDKPLFRQEASLLWYQQIKLKADIVARRRGVYPLGAHSLGAGDLLGFFEIEKKPRDTVNILVYPRLVPLKAVKLPIRELFGLPGAKSLVKDPIYILGTRDYQPSAPSRHIHWKASARHLRLQEKIFEPSEQGKILIALEVESFQKKSDKDAFERTLEAIASLAVQLYAKGCAVGLATNGILTGGVFANPATTRSPGQLPAILEILARLQMVPKNDLEPILRRSLKTSRGFSCAYFSYSTGRVESGMLNYCRERSIPIRFFVCHREPTPRANWQNSWTKEYPLDEICIQENRPV
ncbi:MAG: DUF58 domain-containing protein [Desulfobacterales bacterium]|jgi:uncharacterized protein (DUF58 family)